MSGGKLVLEGQQSIIDTGTLNVLGTSTIEVERRERVAVFQIDGNPQTEGIWGAHWLTRSQHIRPDRR